MWCETQFLVRSKQFGDTEAVSSTWYSSGKSHLTLTQSPTSLVKKLRQYSVYTKNIYSQFISFWKVPPFRFQDWSCYPSLEKAYTWQGQHEDYRPVSNLS